MPLHKSHEEATIPPMDKQFNSKDNNLADSNNNLLRLDSLNPQQKQAVLTTEGPVLVLAGAGTGKTRVLTSRIAYILQKNLCDMHQILAVTFTNKAAAEIKERIQKFLGASVALPWVGTFHFIGIKILRRFASQFGLSSDFAILNQGESLRIIKDILKGENFSTDKTVVKKTLDVIDRWKNEALTPEDITEQHIFPNDNGFEKEIYKLYQDRLKTAHLCDFNDLLLYPILLLKNPDHKEILRYYQKQFRYILIDEYQDINMAQYLLMRLLAGNHRDTGPNFFCVGDEDQTIYQWRGADIERILNFEKDFGQATIIRLETNYRSTQPILTAASQLISYNKKRYGKTLHAHNHQAAAVLEIHESINDFQEAQDITEEILKLKKQNHTLNNIAILTRTTAQHRLFENSFLQHEIPYQIIGAMHFYENREIKDMLAYLGLVYNPFNDWAFLRIVNVPSRGMGPKNLNLLRNYAHQHRLSLFEAAKQLIKTTILTPKTSKNLAFFIEQITHWHNSIPSTSARTLADQIMNNSGYLALYNDKFKDIPDENKALRRKNLKQLVEMINTYPSLKDFLENIALHSQQHDANRQDCVKLMSLHVSKGLEFDIVFLPGWEEKLFPSEKTLEESGKYGLEEERRLAYVGITRAKKRLFIWSSKYRNRFDGGRPMQPSCFIEELLSDKTSPLYYKKNYNNSKVFAKRNFTQRSQQNWQTDQQHHRKIDHQSKTSPIKGNLTQGDRIFHTKYGYGDIINIDHDKLLIAFDKAGEKRVLASFVEKI